MDIEQYSRSYLRQVVEAPSLRLFEIPSSNKTACPLNSKCPCTADLLYGGQPPWRLKSADKVKLDAFAGPFAKEFREQLGFRLSRPKFDGVWYLHSDHMHLNTSDGQLLKRQTVVAEPALLQNQTAALRSPCYSTVSIVSIQIYITPTIDSLCHLHHHMLSHCIANMHRLFN